MRRNDVTWLCVGDRAVASTRVRAYEVGAALAARGWTSRAIAASGLAGRVRVLRGLRARRSVVVLQKVFYGPLMLRLVRSRADVLVLECDDAVQIGYPDASPSARRRQARAVRGTLEVVDLVTTTTPLLAADLKPARGTTIWYPGPAPAVSPTTSPPEGRLRVVLWLGSPSTTCHLSVIAALPMSLAARGWRCVAVGAGDHARQFGWEVLPWSEETSTQWLSRAAVGLMPQAGSDWDDRKAAYKVLQYASAGVVPVASDVPPARLLLGEPPFSSLLVTPQDAWLETIERAWAMRSEWQSHLFAMAGRYSADRAADTWLKGLDACK